MEVLGRKPIGEVGCCESLMAERTHWWIARWLECLSICLSVYLSICLPIYLSIYLSVCLYVSICLSICLSAYLSVFLSICLSICLSIYLSTYLPLYLPICLSVYVSICLSTCRSIYLPIYLPICLFFITCLFLSVYLPIYLPIFLSTYPSIYLSVFLSIFLSTCLFVRPVLRKPTDLMLQNATLLRKSAPWPPNISDEHVFCTAPAARNASFQILFKCPTAAHRFWTCYKTLTFCSLLTRCTIPCACHTKRGQNVQNWSERGVLCKFWRQNVLRVTTECTFSTSQLPKSASRMVCFYHFNFEISSRHNAVHFFDISTSKSIRTITCM